MNLGGANGEGSGGFSLRLAAAAGLAVVPAQLLMAPGGVPGRSAGGVAATLAAPAYLPSLAGCAILLLLAGPALERRVGASRLGIGLQAMAALLAVPPLSGLFFRGSLWPVLALTLGIASWRIARLQEPAPQTAAARTGERSPQRLAAPAVAALVTLLVGIPLAFAAPPTQGDEPHYLLVAHSIWQDGDIDLADDYGAREDLAFHRGAISPHYKPGLREGSRYSMHGVGYPLLLLPEYAVAMLAGDGATTVLLARLLQVALLAAAAALMTAWAGRRTDPRSALLATLLVTVCAPMLFAPVSLFPETAAMLLSCTGFLGLQRGSPRAAALAGGVAVAVLPWLGVKYIPLAGAVAVGALIARAERPEGWRIGLALGPLAAALVAHALFTLTLYGSVSPSSLYLGADPEFGRQPGYGSDWWAYIADWQGAVRTMVGYFFDQKEGLLVLAPQFLLLGAGVRRAWRVLRPELFAVLMICLAHLGPYALSQQIGGQSPPGRPLMAILWTLALPLAFALQPVGGRVLAFGRGALPALGVSLTLALALDPTLLPHDYAVTEAWLLRDLSPQGSELWRYFPLWLNLRGTAQWVPTLAWTAAMLTLIVMLARSAGAAPAPGTARRLGWAGAAAALMIVSLATAHAARLVVTARHTGAEIAPGVEAWVLRSVPERAWAEPGGVWVAPGPGREIVLLIDRSSAARAGATLDLRLRTLRGGLVRIGAAGSWIQEPIEAGPPVARTLHLGSAYEWRGRSAYRVVVGAAEGIEPARQDGGGDWRPLGVFLQVAGGGREQEPAG